MQEEEIDPSPEDGRTYFDLEVDPLLEDGRAYFKAIEVTRREPHDVYFRVVSRAAEEPARWLELALGDGFVSADACFRVVEDSAGLYVCSDFKLERIFFQLLFFSRTFF